MLQKRAQAALTKFWKALNPDVQTAPDEDLVEMSAALTVSLADIVEKSTNMDELEAALDETLAQLKAEMLAKAAGDEEELAEGATGTRVPPGKKKKTPMNKDDVDDIDKHLTEDGTVSDRATILKGLSPAGVALIEKLEKGLSDATEAAAAALKIAKTASDALAEQSLTTLAEDLTDGTLTTVPEAVALLKMAGDDADKRKSVETMLKRQREMVAKSPLFEEHGDDLGGSPNAEDELQRLAEERVSKSGGKLTYQKAYAQVMKENPELYEAILDGDDIEPVEPAAG